MQNIYYILKGTWQALKVAWDPLSHSLNQFLKHSYRQDFLFWVSSARKVHEVPFVLLSAAYISATFERFCYNDVEEPCKSFFNCTPCHLTLADPTCDRIQYGDVFTCNTTNQEDIAKQLKLQIKTESEISNCTELKNQCQLEFDDCMLTFSNCIYNCTEDLRNTTLTTYESYDGIFEKKYFDH